MKKVLVLLSLGFVFLQGFGQDNVLLTINNKSVSEGEFLRIYNKNNNTGNLVDKKTIDEYLDLFINFKLKVTEAESLGMDTLTKFTRELGGYKNQLEKPYFTDKNIDERLVKEAYERQQFDVRASHILIMVSKEASPADTLVAYNKIKSIRKQIVDDKKDFRKLAAQYSEDPSAKQNGGDLGYFTVFQMVYPFENAAYNTEVGEVSEIVRTRFGYHILKIADKRKAKGEVQVAHIMIAVSGDADSVKAEAAQNKINMIYKRLQNGEGFKELAQLYSDDKASAKNGGILQWFGTGKMVPEFENAAFGLEHKGDYAKPIRTNFGWHIIKLIDRKEPLKFEETEKSLKDRISTDMRGRTSQVAVYERLEKEYKYQLNQKQYDAFVKSIDPTIFSGEWDHSKIKNMNQKLFILNDSIYTQQAFVTFLDKNILGKRKEEPIKPFIDHLFRIYLESELKQVEREHLADKYPEYKYLLQEYHDGILLFDLTDQEVWSKAIEDSLGLYSFYENHKNNYMWGTRVKAQIYSVKDNKVMAGLKKLLSKSQAKGYTKDYILMKLNKKDSSAVELVNENTYSSGDYTIVDEANEKLQFFENGSLKTPLYFEKDNKLVFIDQIISKENKKLEEAKGQITADYQDYLEKQWVEALRKKYKVEINQAVWEKIKSNQ